jgi:hypothetical protein
MTNHSLLESLLLVLKDGSDEVDLSPSLRGQEESHYKQILASIIRVTLISHVPVEIVLASEPLQ